MRIPKKAPPFLDLMRTVGAERFADLVGLTPGPLVHGKYLHWDELLRRSPPDSLNHQEWWLGIKHQRYVGRKPIPLTDTGGRAFTFSLVDPIPQLLHGVDLRAGGSIRMPDPVMNPETRDQYYVNSLIEEAITSSQLEGAMTTRQVAKEMLRSGRAPRDRSEQMIVNNFLTMQKLREWTSEPLSPEVVLEIHRSVAADTLDDPSAVGRIRRPDEPVVVEDIFGEVMHNPPPAGQLKDRLDAMCAFANDPQGQFIHPVVRAIILHFWLAYDHPFVDGNGRSARALFYWFMLRQGYWMVEFLSVSRLLLKAPARYARAFLHSETDENDLTYFLLHQLGILRRAMDDLHDYIARKTSEVQQLASQLRAIDLLNHRQRDLIAHAIRHPGVQYTVEGHRRSHGVVYETARSDLLDLAHHRKLLRGQKRGKQWVFVAVPDIVERLKALG